MPIPSFRFLDDDSLVLPVALEEFAGNVLGIVRQVYTEIGPGLKEPIYQEALGIALTDAGIVFIAKPRLRVVFRGRPLRKPVEPDFLVGDHIVLELKAVEEFHPSHHAQLVTYLRVAKRPLGFLINFNAPRLGLGIKRKVLT